MGYVYDSFSNLWSTFISVLVRIRKSDDPRRLKVPRFRLGPIGSVDGDSTHTSQSPVRETLGPVLRPLPRVQPQESVTTLGPKDDRNLDLLSPTTGSGRSKFPGNGPDLDRSGRYPVILRSRKVDRLVVKDLHTTEGREDPGRGLLEHRHHRSSTSWRTKTLTGEGPERRDRSFHGYGDDTQLRRQRRR